MLNRLTGTLTHAEQYRTAIGIIALNSILIAHRNQSDPTIILALFYKFTCAWCFNNNSTTSSWPFSEAHVSAVYSSYGKWNNERIKQIARYQSESGSRNDLNWREWSNVANSNCLGSRSLHHFANQLARRASARYLPLRDNHTLMPSSKLYFPPKDKGRIRMCDE